MNDEKLKNLHCIVEERNRVEEESKDYLKENLTGDFKFHPRSERNCEYFPASIVQITDENGNDLNKLRVFHPNFDEPDLEIDGSSLLQELKQTGVKMLY